MECKSQVVIDSFKSGHIFDRDRMYYFLIFLIKAFLSILCGSTPFLVFNLQHSFKSLYVGVGLIIAIIFVFVVTGFTLSKMTVGLYIDIIDAREGLVVYEESCNIQNVDKIIKKCRGCYMYASKLLEDDSILAEGNGNSVVYYVEYNGVKVVVNISKVN